jgi:hypothetical protein
MQTRSEWVKAINERERERERETKLSAPAQSIISTVTNDNSTGLFHKLTEVVCKAKKSCIFTVLVSFLLLFEALVFVIPALLGTSPTQVTLRIRNPITKQVR